MLRGVSQHDPAMIDIDVSQWHRYRVEVLLGRLRRETEKPPPPCSARRIPCRGLSSLRAACRLAPRSWPSGGRE